MLRSNRLNHRDTEGTEKRRQRGRQQVHGACFISFERAVNAERVISVLGEYCEGPKFHQRPETEQRRRAIEFLRDRAVLMVWDN